MPTVLILAIFAAGSVLAEAGRRVLLGGSARYHNPNRLGRCGQAGMQGLEHNGRTKTDASEGELRNPVKGAHVNMRTGVPRIGVVIVCFILGWIFWSAGNALGDPTPPANLSPGLQEIVKLAQAGMSDDVILAYIKNSGTSYKMSADDILYLNSQGVSQNAILTLLQTKSTTYPNSAPVNPAANSPYRGATANPQITSVTFSGSPGNYTVTVTGSGFGTLPSGLPFNGNTPYFRIADAVQLGFGEWGYSGDAQRLIYQSWSDTQVQVSGFSGRPGDAITLTIWNPASGVGATWGGNVPPIPAGTPKITSVTFSGSGHNLKITVNGFGIRLRTGCGDAIYR